MLIFNRHQSNYHASYHIGIDPADLENAPSFDEANFSSLDEGKHLASSLSRISLIIFILCHDCELTYRSLMKP
jgi:streptomycin 6-kinase